MKRSPFERARKKQSDADEIKRWEKELNRAFQSFNVRSSCSSDGGKA
jgi:hypothetical protein